MILGISASSSPDKEAITEIKVRIGGKGKPCLCEATVTIIGSPVIGEKEEQDYTVNVKCKCVRGELISCTLKKYEWYLTSSRFPKRGSICAEVTGSRLKKTLAIKYSKPWQKLDERKGFWKEPATIGVMVRGNLSCIGPGDEWYLAGFTATVTKKVTITSKFSDCKEIEEKITNTKSKIRTLNWRRAGLRHEIEEKLQKDEEYNNAKQDLDAWKKEENQAWTEYFKLEDEYKEVQAKLVAWNECLKRGEKFLKFSGVRKFAGFVHQVKKRYNNKKIDKLTYIYAVLGEKHPEKNPELYRKRADLVQVYKVFPKVAQALVQLGQIFVNIVPSQGMKGTLYVQTAAVILKEVLMREIKEPFGKLVKEMESLPPQQWGGQANKIALKIVDQIPKWRKEIVRLRLDDIYTRKKWEDAKTYLKNAENGHKEAEKKVNKLEKKMSKELNEVITQIKNLQAELEKLYGKHRKFCLTPEEKLRLLIHP